MSPETSSPSTLNYAGTGEPETVQIDVRHDGGVTITVPSRRSLVTYVASTANWVLEAHLLAVVLVPLVACVACVLYLLFATRKPRAVLRLTPDEFTATETSDEGLGRRQWSRSWTLSSVGDLRPNRYESGLWVTIRGKDSFNLLGELSKDEIMPIGDALAAARERVASGS